jgi:hypothetical protein
MSATDRRDEPKLLREVQEKYRTQPLQVFNLGYQSLAIRVSGGDC